MVYRAHVSYGTVTDELTLIPARFKSLNVPFRLRIHLNSRGSLVRIRASRLPLPHPMRNRVYLWSLAARPWLRLRLRGEAQGPVQTNFIRTPSPHRLKANHRDAPASHLNHFKTRSENPEWNSEVFLRLKRPSFWRTKTASNLLILLA